MSEFACLETYLENIKAYPLLSNEETLNLHKKYIKDKNQVAGNLIIKSNLRLVINLAKKYRNRGVPFEDLIQEGTFGLYDALEKFEPGRGCQFSTCASWWILHRLTRSVVEKGKLIRIPAYILQALTKFNRAKTRLHHILGMEPTNEMVLDKINNQLRPTQVSGLKNFLQTKTFLYNINEDSKNNNYGDIIEGRESEPIEQMINEENNSQLEKYISKLNPRQKFVIKNRLAGNTLDEVGQKIVKIAGKTMTKERVRQIENEAILNMQKMMI